MGDQDHAGQVLQVGVPWQHHQYKHIQTHEQKRAPFGVRGGEQSSFPFSSLQAGGGLQAGESRRANAALLDLTWLEDGAVAFKADNGKFVGTKKSGHLFANVDTVEERSKYVKQ